MIILLFSFFFFPLSFSRAKIVCESPEDIDLGRSGNKLEKEERDGDKDRQIYVASDWFLSRALRHLRKYFGFRFESDLKKSDGSLIKTDISVV